MKTSIPPLSPPSSLAKLFNRLRLLVPSLLLLIAAILLLLLLLRSDPPHFISSVNSNPSHPTRPPLSSIVPDHDHPAPAFNRSPPGPPKPNLSLFVHEMDDPELLRAVSKPPYNAHRVPDGAVPKVAFMFLTRNALPLAPLWEKFFEGHRGLYSIYVHSHLTNNNLVRSKQSVFHGRIIPSKVVKWGRVNMIEAERRLLASALLDTLNQRFVLLSDSCIPLFNFSTIYSYLINSTKSSYIEVYDSRGKTGRGRFRPILKPLITIRQWRKGSQWFEVDRYIATRVVSDRTYFPAFQRSCKRKACYADEHYLPTFANIKFRERNAGRSLTWVDWTKGGAHPGRFVRPSVTPKFLEKMRFGSECEYNGKKSHVCYLFARKFTSHALERLLWFAPKVMRFDD
uniref:Core-2/I-branching beta-1,6-N-acetylglucosaminyltransferase family protein n=1 Tax=Kalanchoe fedtschenkoi TaxID=63787 RepID=A0A7N0UHE1_KALFE